MHCVPNSKGPFLLYSVCLQIKAVSVAFKRASPPPAARTHLIATSLIIGAGGGGGGGGGVWGRTD